MRDEQLLRYRHRRQDKPRLSPQARGASREVQVEGQELYVVRGFGLQAVAPENVQEPGSEGAAGVRWTENSPALLAGHCGTQYSKVSYRISNKCPTL